MEGYYWRFCDHAAGRVAVVLCGVCRAPDGPWAMVTLAAHPGGFVRTVLTPSAHADPRGLGVTAGGALRAAPDRLELDLGPGARLAAELGSPRAWPRRGFGGLGPAQVVPGLPQYWHPHLLGARVSGSAQVGGETWDLAAATAYAEKNWGSEFHHHWWWGQADAIAGADACVAFAGGRLRAGRPSLPATAMVVRLGGQMLRFGPPLSAVAGGARDGAWHLRARSARHTVELEGDGAGPAHVLPVPVVAERRTEPRSRQHLAGRLQVVVRRGRRTLLRGESAHAGLEHGTPA